MYTGSSLVYSYLRIIYPLCNSKLGATPMLQNWHSLRLAFKEVLLFSFYHLSFSRRADIN